MFRPVSFLVLVFLLLLPPATTSALAVSRVTLAALDTPALSWPDPATKPPASAPATRPAVTSDLFAFADCRGRLDFVVRSGEAPDRRWSYTACGDGRVAWHWRRDLYPAGADPSSGSSAASHVTVDAVPGVSLAIEWAATPFIPTAGDDDSDRFYHDEFRQAADGSVTLLRRLRTPANVPDLDYRYAADSLSELMDADPDAADEVARLFALVGQSVPASRYCLAVWWDESPTPSIALAAWCEARIAELDDRDYRVRDKATDALLAGGDDAAMYLRTVGPWRLSPEQDGRVTSVLRAWPAVRRKPWTARLARRAYLAAADAVERVKNVVDSGLDGQ